LTSLSALPALAQTAAPMDQPTTSTPRALPNDCLTGDLRPECQQQAQTPEESGAVGGPARRQDFDGPYDPRPYGAGRPDANGLNDQPKNGHDGGG